MYGTIISKPQSGSWIEFSIAFLYLVGMTSFGSHVVAVAQEVTVFAENCHTSPTSIGTVFLANGFGAIVGSMSASPLFKNFNGEMVMGMFLLLLAAVSFGLPNVTSVIILHILYFLSGVGTGLMDAGPNIMMERLLGKRMAPWLIALQVGFNLGGFLGVLVELVLSLDAYSLFYLIGGILSFLGLLCFCLPLFRRCIPPTDQLVISMSAQPSLKMANNMSEQSSMKMANELDDDNAGLQLVEYSKIEQDLGVDAAEGEDETLDLKAKVRPFHDEEDASKEELNGGKDIQAKVVSVPGIGQILPESTISAVKLTPANYYSDICLGLVVLFLIGSNVATTAYLPAYAIDTTIESLIAANWQICIFWLVLTLGLSFSLVIRKFLFTSDHHVPYLFTTFTSLAAFACLIMLAIPDHLRTRKVLWVAVVINGFFSGPSIGLAFQYYSVVTFSTETSFAIASLGLNIGAGFLPYLVTALWSNVLGPNALFIILFVSLMLSIPLFLLSSYISCKPRTVSL